MESNDILGKKTFLHYISGELIYGIFLNRFVCGAFMGILQNNLKLLISHKYLTFCLGGGRGGGGD